MASLLRLLGRPRTRPKTRSRAFKPSLETLEGRCVPATSGFVQTNLVSDQMGVALVTDTDLKNAWGIALSPTGGAFWVSDNNTNVATLYAGDVNGSTFHKVGLTVAMPNNGSPTGQVFNTTSDFILSDGSKALFIFADESGQIDAWNPGLSPINKAEMKATVPGADFTGIAIDSVKDSKGVVHNGLLAVDTLNGKIDAFDSSFHQVTLPPGLFHDKDLPANFVPYNVKNLGNHLIAITYTRNDLAQGFGTVGLFTDSGKFLTNLKGDVFSSPWGMALAPSNFGPFSNDLLVGNLTSGWIAAYSTTTGKFVDFLRDPSGNIVTIDGLWGLQFGNGVSAGDSNALYFSSGPDNYAHGLFGSLRFESGMAGSSAVPHSMDSASSSGNELAVLAHTLMDAGGSMAAAPPIALPPGIPHGTTFLDSGAVPAGHATAKPPDFGAHGHSTMDAATQAIDMLFAGL
jgi:uncharacterized protein (TIGR03118 family)